MEAIRLGKDEMNLAEFPITLLTDRAPKGKQVIQFQDTIFDEKCGKRITRKLTISADETHGLPTAADDDVILGLIQLTKSANNFTSREVEFSRLELIRLLGWPDSGDSYRRLSISLKRWLSVTLLYENAWRDNQRGVWVTKGFHILDNIELNDTRTTGDQGELFPSKILWNKVVFESFAAGYLRTIDYGLYVNLNHPIARRMYRFLGKRMYFGPDLVFDLRDLAFAHIGLSAGYIGNAGKIKEKLQPAIEELESVGFLIPIEKIDRYYKDGKNWKIRLTVAGQTTEPPASVPSVASTSHATEDFPLVAALIERGVTRATAAGLVERHPVARIAHKLEVFDWLTAQQDKRVARSPAGYLVTSVEQDYADPKGFIPKAERERRAAAQRAREHDAAEAQRREREHDAREHAKQQRDVAYWDALTEAERDALDAASRAQADPEARALEARSDPIARRIGQHLRRSAYIRQLLDRRDAAAAADPE